MPFPAVLLRHTRPTDTHYDLLLGDPDAPGAADALLVAFRVATPWTHWAVLGRFTLTALPPHRRRYLTYQGPLWAGRGHVTRVAAGTYTPTLWTPSRRVLTLASAGSLPAPLLLEARNLGDARWLVTVTERPAAASGMG